MKIIPATFEKHAESIRATLNHYIRTGTEFYRTEEMTADDMKQWFDDRIAGNYPILCAEEDDGTFLGFAACGTYHTFVAYRYTAEASLYVVPGKQRQGVGLALQNALDDACRARGIHMLVAVVDSKNTASIALCRKTGFVYTGYLEHVARKFDAWRNIDFYQKIY